MKKRKFVAMSVSFALIAGLSGCQQSAPSDKSEAELAPEAKPGLALSDGTLMLPVVAGRPGAAYFTLRNTSGKEVELAGVYIDGAASAEIHETQGGQMTPVERLVIPAGDSADFARGGLHVMAFDLSDALSAGGTTEITLTFSDGDKLSAPLEVKAMGDAGGMAGMDHGDHH